MEVILDTDKLEAKLSTSDFAQVVFHNVAESYPPDADVVCHYTLTEPIIPTTSDWIGVYKVGWTSARDYQTFNYVPAILKKENEAIENSVMFKAYYLPKEDGEFYQFVYVNKNAEVRGASTPFQFRSPSADDFIEIEDEHTDMLLIKTKTMYCEERLTQTREEKNKLQRQVMKYEELRDEMNEVINKLQEELDEEKKHYVQIEGWYKKALSTCGSMENKKCSLEVTLKGTEDKLMEAVNERDVLTAELEKLTADVIQSDVMIEELQKDKLDLELKLEEMEVQVDLYKDHFATSEIENRKKKKVPTATLR